MPEPFSRSRPESRRPFPPSQTGRSAAKPNTYARAWQAVLRDRYAVLATLPQLWSATSAGLQDAPLAGYCAAFADDDMTLPKPLRLALIGMSGSGKTFWANRLAEAAFPRVSCDERIEARLRGELGTARLRGIGGVAAWMGWPDHPAYQEREAKYLEAEIAAMNDVLDDLERDMSRELVLDTTGSIIYTGEAIRNRLRRQMTVVYLAASAEEQSLLAERYLSDPKPVLWRDAYRPLPAESPRETVARCYPVLIDRRHRLYETYAHCTLPMRELHDRRLDARGLLARIESEMSRTR